MRSLRLLAVLLSGTLVCSVESPSRAGAPDRPAAAGRAFASHAETPHDPPAAWNPSQDLLARTPGFRPQAGPYASVQVNVDALGQNIVGDAANEPSIAVNPLNPSNMVIGWRQFDTILSNFRQAGHAYTFDRGVTWTFPGSLDPGFFHSDPVLDADADGNFYYASLQSTTRMWVFKSADGGVTWIATPAAAGDKEWLAVDRSSGPGRGHVYVVWQPFAACCGFRTFSRSVDGGGVFQVPTAVTRSPYFGTIAVGPDGELYAAGFDATFGSGDRFAVAKSVDARNASVSPTFTAVPIDLGGRAGDGDPNPGGLVCQTSVAVDTSTGPRRGNVYVVGCVTAPGSPDPLDVVVVRSTDGGATWSAPTRINDDIFQENWQWFAAVSVAPNGRIDVVWYDTRNSGEANISQLFYAWSYDGGVSWSQNAVVSPAFDSHVGYPQQQKIGDYITIVSDATGGHVAYAATFNGEQDVYYVNVFPDCNANGVSDVTDIATGSSVDTDADGYPDECELLEECQAAGAVPDGAFAPGTPLTLEKAAGDAVRLSWGASCADDPDFSLYEGAIGSFAGHVPRLCSTAGARSADLVPSVPAAYFLVVPANGICEGSHGVDWRGREREQGPAPCRAQNVRPCPFAARPDARSAAP